MVSAQRYVAVIGPGDDATESEVLDAAYAGRRLAQAGAIVVTGGLGGVMGSAARGAQSVGGLSIGFLPGFDRGDAAPDHSLTVPTGLGEMRNALVVRAADVVLAVGGSWGTQSEISLAVRTGIPVIVCRGWPQPTSGPMIVETITQGVDAVLAIISQ